MADETPVVVTDADVRDPNLLLRFARKVVSRLSDVGTRLGKLERAPAPPSIQAIRKELQVGGSAPLNLTQLPGVARQPQLAGAPRLSSTPSGLILQQYQDTQLLLIGTTSTGFNLSAVVAGNPNSLYQLIAGLSTGTVSSTSTNLMTLDTTQTSTGDKTLTGVWTFNGTLTATSTATFNSMSVGKKITSYDGIATTAEGVPYIIARSAITNQSSNSSATLYTTTTTGEYRLSWYLGVSSTGTSAASIAYQYTDDIGVHTINSTGLVNFATAQLDQGTRFIRAASGTTISIGVSIATSTVAPIGSYNVFSLLERLS